MPAYSFKERFVPLIKAGTKRQTIRAKRKRPAKPGDQVYLYYGMRTKWCTKIGEGVCRAVDNITIKRNGLVFVNNKLLKNWDKEILAKADGFKDFAEMLSWWKQTHALPFNGDIIYW